MGRMILGVAGWMTLLRGVVAYGQETSDTPAITDFFPLLILLVVFGAIFYFMLIRPQRRRQQQMNQLVGSLHRGDKVVTAGGIHGEIDSVGDTSVVLVLEEGAKVRLAKTSVVRKLDR
jgi:preprotein translocase subunit YajC